jgi:ABC-type nitrate/sulfonate/bicarbonate transport system substrate-binding protein
MLRTLVFVLVIISSASQVLCAENQKLDRIRFGYSSISGSRIALWVTSEMGFFSKNGLAAEAIVTPGIQGTQALIAGELQFYLGGVDSAALSASRGSDLVALATDRSSTADYSTEYQNGQRVGGKRFVDRVGGTIATFSSSAKSV